MIQWSFQSIMYMVLGALGGTILGAAYAVRVKLERDSNG